MIATQIQLIIIIIPHVPRVQSEGFTTFTASAKPCVPTVGLWILQVCIGILTNCGFWAQELSFSSINCHAEIT